MVAMDKPSIAAAISLMTDHSGSCGYTNGCPLQAKTIACLINARSGEAATQPVTLATAQHIPCKTQKNSNSIFQIKIYFLLSFRLLKLNCSSSSNIAEKTTAMTWSSDIADVMINDNFLLQKNKRLKKALTMFLFHN